MLEGVEELARKTDFMSSRIFVPDIVIHLTICAKSLRSPGLLHCDHFKVGRNTRYRVVHRLGANRKGACNET